MFDKTIVLTSTDSTVSLSITAGTEGVKSILISAAEGQPPKAVTAQKLIDVVAPTLREWFNAPPAPAPISSAPSGS
jgi:hypothetical protein